jgi:hypothetical protein
MAACRCRPDAVRPWTASACHRCASWSFAGEEGLTKPGDGVYRCAGGHHNEMVRHDNGVAVDRVAAAVDVALHLLVLAPLESARLRRVNPYGNRCGNMTGEPPVTDPPGAACASVCE